MDQHVCTEGCPSIISLTKPNTLVSFYFLPSSSSVCVCVCTVSVAPPPPPMLIPQIPLTGFVARVQENSKC